VNPKRQRFDFVLKNSKFENETENEVSSEYQVQDEEENQDFENYQPEQEIETTEEREILTVSQNQNENEELFVVKKKIESIYDRVNTLQTRY
jgi:hypothetical protein